MAIYIVSRIYSKKERPDASERSIYYGWSNDKNTVKAFLKQRTKGKYAYKKFDETEIRTDILEEIQSNSRDSMLDFVKLTFASNGQEIRFYTTMREMHEAEINIQNRFHDLCSIDDPDVLKLYMSLDRYYLDALYLIGFRPKEIDIMFDSSDSLDGYNSSDLTNYEIDCAYDGEGQSPAEYPWNFMNPPGLALISTIGDKILYSVENFITALRDEF